MKNNLKICLIIYIMSSIKQSNENYNLEGGVDFGSDKLNDFYKGLDRKIQVKIRDQMSKEVAIKLLTLMSNPLIEDLYQNLPIQEQKSLNKMYIVNKYEKLEKLLEKKQIEDAKSAKDVKFMPRTPSNSPQPRTPPLPTTPVNTPPQPRTPVDTPPPIKDDVPSEIFHEEELEELEAVVEAPRGKTPPQERLDNFTIHIKAK